MAEVVIYSSPYCGYCTRAKALLARKGVSYRDIDVIAEPGRRAEMVERAGGRTTVPQIFINGCHVGGCDDLHALETKGELDSLLAVAA